MLREKGVACKAKAFMLKTLHQKSKGMGVLVCVLRNTLAPFDYSSERV